MLNVKIAKVVIMPSTTPRGLRLPPEDAEDNTIGRMGQMHGAKIVANPEMNANNSSIIMNLIPTFFKVGMYIHLVLLRH